jgi:hypothetical protein
MIAQQSIGLFTQRSHQLLMIPGRITQQLLHALAIALTNIFLNSTDVLAARCPKQPAQIAARMFTDVLASYYKMRAKEFAEFHESPSHPFQAAVIIF